MENTMIHGTVIIDHGEEFKVPASEFFISPISTNTQLCILGTSDDVTNIQPVYAIEADKYTKVTSNNPRIRWKVNTTEVFSVSW